MSSVRECKCLNVIRKGEVNVGIHAYLAKLQRKTRWPRRRKARLLAMTILTVTYNINT